MIQNKQPLNESSIIAWMIKNIYIFTENQEGIK